MFQEFKSLFARSWEAFVTERDRREPEDRVADMLSAMRRELVEARAALPLLDDAVQEVETELARERAERDACARRRGQAERIGDRETVRVAAEWEARHAARAAVLEEKHRAAVAERDLRRQEAEQMTQRLRLADARRHALVAELRARGRAAGQGGEDLDDVLHRWGEDIESRSAHADALGELEEQATAPPSPSSEIDLDARLRELKRRLGTE